MAGLPNYDYDVESAALQRRLQLADAMQQGSLAPMGPTETVGGYAVKRSPLDALAKVAQAYFAHKQQDNVRTEQQQLASRYRADTQQGISSLMDGLNATPGQATEVADESGGHTGAPMTLQDAQAAKRAAILNAVGSNVPAVQQLGMGFINQMQKDYMTQKDWAALGDKWDPESVLAAQRTGNMQLLRPKKQALTVNGQVITGTPESGFTPAGDFRDKFGAVGPVAQTSAGPVLGQSNTSTGEVKFAPPGTNVNLNTTQTAAEKFAGGIAGERATILADSYKAAKDLPKTLQQVKEAQALIDAGIKSGAGADLRVTISKVGQQLGIGNGDPAAANSEEFRGKLANAVLDKIKILRPASDNDVTYAKQASGADLNLSLQALSRLLDSAEATVYNTYLSHEDLLRKASGGQGALPEDLQMFHVNLPIHTDRLQFVPGAQPGAGDNGERTTHGGFFQAPPPPKSAAAPAPGGGGGGVIPLEEYLRSKGR